MTQTDIQIYVKGHQMLKAPYHWRESESPFKPENANVTNENRSELVTHQWTETTPAELLQVSGMYKSRSDPKCSQNLRTNYKLKLTTTALRTWSQHRTISKPPQGRISRDTTIRFRSGNFANSLFGKAFHTELKDKGEICSYLYLSVFTHHAK